MDYFVFPKMDRWALGAQKTSQNRQKCRKNVFVRDNINNGWMDFDNSFFIWTLWIPVNTWTTLFFKKWTGGRLAPKKSLPKQAKCRKNVFVRDNLNNGWMDFDISFFIGTLSILINTWTTLFREKMDRLYTGLLHSADAANPLV